MSDTTTAVALALLVTVTFSGAFFYMMRWAAASSERQRSRHRRVIAGDDFTTTKHKKTVIATTVVRQRKKNDKNAVVRPSSASASSTVSANDKNSDNNKKKKTVDNCSVLVNDDVTVTAASVGNRRTRRQKHQKQAIQSHKDHTPEDSSTATVPVNNHLFSSVDDVPVDDEGGWITMSSGNNNNFITIDTDESNRRKVIENKTERYQPQVEKQQKRERRLQQTVKPGKTAVGIAKAAPIIPAKVTTIVTSPSQSQDKPVVTQEYDITSQHDITEKHLRAKLESVQAKMKSLRAEHEITIKKLRADSENTRVKHSAVTERLHAAEREITTLKQMRSEQETALKTLNLKFENLKQESIQDAHSNYKSIIEEIKVKHESVVLNLRKENEVLRKNHETAVQDLQKVAINLSEKYELEIKKLKADHESTIRQIRKENSDLHTEHANAIKVLQDEHESVMAAETQRLTEYHTAVMERLLNQPTTCTKLHQSSNHYQDNDTVTITPSDVENNSDLEMRNKKLHRTVLHYKQIIADTEQMLNQLHIHVEKEEFHWSKHAANLQKQLDETRRQLEDQISQQNRIKNHDS